MEVGAIGLAGFDHDVKDARKFVRHRGDRRRPEGVNPLVDAVVARVRPNQMGPPATSGLTPSSCLGFHSEIREIARGVTAMVVGSGALLNEAAARRRDLGAVRRG